MLLTLFFTECVQSNYLTKDEKSHFFV